MLKIHRNENMRGSAQAGVQRPLAGLAGRPRGPWSPACADRFLHSLVLMASLFLLARFYPDALEHGWPDRAALETLLTVN